ncbi:MAG: hypothetical protein ACREMV_11445 [Gemmatimonadales bacterium]
MGRRVLAFVLLSVLCAANAPARPGTGRAGGCAMCAKHCCCAPSLKAPGARTCTISRSCSRGAGQDPVLVPAARDLAVIPAGFHLTPPAMRNLRPMEPRPQPLALRVPPPDPPPRFLV